MVQQVRGRQAVVSSALSVSTSIYDSYRYANVLLPLSLVVQSFTDAWDTAGPDTEASCYLAVYLVAAAVAVYTLVSVCLLNTHSPFPTTHLAVVFWWPLEPITTMSLALCSCPFAYLSSRCVEVALLFGST